MRLYGSLIVFIIILYSCHQKPSNKLNIAGVDSVKSISADNYSTGTPEQRLAKYKWFVAHLDDSTLKLASVAAEAFGDYFKGQNPEICDKAFVIFNEFYDRLLTNLNEAHHQDTTDYDVLFEHYNGTQPEIPKKISDYKNKLSENGFYISWTEGTTDIHEDGDFIARWFYPYVSTEMKQYLTQLNKEDKEGTEADGGMTIPAKELVDRAVWWESFNKAHQDFVFHSKVLENKADYLALLLEGTDNTPLLDGPDKVSKYFVEAYRYLLSKYSGTEMAKVIGPYYTALKQRDHVAADSIKRRNMRVEEAD